MAVLNFEEALDAMKEAVEITPEKSETKVVVYQDSVILTHRLMTVIGCVHCGLLKNAFIHPDNGLDHCQNDHMAHQLDKLKRCECV